jgi:hypothetical protein
MAGAGDDSDGTTYSHSDDGEGDEEDEEEMRLRRQEREDEEEEERLIREGGAGIPIGPVSAIRSVFLAFPSFLSVLHRPFFLRPHSICICAAQVASHLLP